MDVCQRILLALLMKGFIFSILTVLSSGFTVPKWHCCCANVTHVCAHSLCKAHGTQTHTFTWHHMQYKRIGTELPNYRLLQTLVKVFHMNQCLSWASFGWRWQTFSICLRTDNGRMDGWMEEVVNGILYKFMNEFHHTASVHQHSAVHRFLAHLNELILQNRCWLYGGTNSIAFHDWEEMPFGYFCLNGVKQMTWWNLANILSIWTMNWSIHGFQGEDVWHGVGPTATATFGSYAAAGKSAVKLGNKNVWNVWQCARQRCAKRNKLHHLTEQGGEFKKSCKHKTHYMFLPKAGAESNFDFRSDNLHVEKGVNFQFHLMCS